MSDLQKAVFTVLEGFNLSPDVRSILEKAYYNPATKPDQNCAVPHDFFTHQASWREALVIAEKHAVVVFPDQDDQAYWQHELRAFDNAYIELWEKVI